MAVFFLTASALRICEAPSRMAAAAWAVAGGLLVGAFVHSAITQRVFAIPEVQPSFVWERLRIPFQAVLIVLLTAVTATDWRTCFIPLFIPFAGLMIAPVLAFVAGDLQICHVWVDWNAEIPQLSGPYLPAWLSSAPHFHGLAWSIAGAAAGAAMAWVVRKISGWVLGMPAFGEGDVWLMAMIGAFLGWQPTVLAFAIAPLAALVIGLPTKLLSGRPYIPYGPFLAFGAITVQFSWRWLWMLEVGLGTTINTSDRRARFRLRDVFGDPVLMAGIAGVVTVALAVMLGWRRWAVGTVAVEPVASGGASAAAENKAGSETRVVAPESPGDPMVP